MAIPFASAYAPINDLNASIQARDARGQQAYLQRRALDNQQVAEAINAVVRQKQIESESGDRRQHYDLQRQQLANDMAYRNQALGMQSSQFDKQFGLNERIATKQMENPFYGQKDALGYGLQASQDAEKWNAEADGATTELNRKKKLLDTFHQNETTRINKQWRSKADLIEADNNYQKALLDLKIGVPGGEKTRYNPVTGEFEALKMSMPNFGQPIARPQPVGQPQGVGQGGGQPMFGEPGFDNTGGGIVPQPQVVPQAAAPRASNPFLQYGVQYGSPSTPPWMDYLRQQGQPSNVRTNAPPVVAIPPPAQLPRRFIYNANGTLSPAP